jgi:hypothetical protein
MKVLSRKYFNPAFVIWFVEADWDGERDKAGV